MTTPGFTPGTPGFTALRESYESSVTFQSFFLGDVVYAPMPVVDSTAVDSTNSPSTSILRPGLVMGKLDSNGQWVDYDPTATDGSQEARGILVVECNLLDYTSGSAADRFANAIVIGGKAKAAALLNLDQGARNQLVARGFIFDDDAWFPSVLFRRTVVKAASYTVVAADHGARFLTTGASGAVTFTLPTIALGLKFAFLNVVDQNMVIASAEGSNMIEAGDLSANSITFSTAGELIGAYCEVEAVYISGALKWLVTILGFKSATGGGSTGTVAT